MDLYLKEKKGSVVLKVKIIPKSSSNCVAGIYGDSLKIKIKAPPEGGKANKECCNFLSKILKVPKKYVNIVSGYKSNVKYIFIENMSIRNFKERVKI